MVVCVGVSFDPRVMTLVFRLPSPLNRPSNSTSLNEAFGLVALGFDRSVLSFFDLVFVLGDVAVGENSDGRRRRCDPEDEELICCRYSRGTNSSNKMRAFGWNSI